MLVNPSSAQQPDADDYSSPEVKALMDAGVASLEDAQYDQAVANFRKVVQLEPANQKAHLYLGTAYAYQVVPNLETPENLRTASAALAEFDIVLKSHPGDLTDPTTGSLRLSQYITVRSGQGAREASDCD
jgi:tetratricopeptide (TPR) repeat protein